jgi:hypothetical protein
LDPEYLVTRVPHPQRVSIWACFSGFGVGEMHIFTENLDADLMKEILQEHLKASAEMLFPPGLWYFQQDNDPKHKSNLVQTWLFNAGICCLDFPPYSPDLNPIENIWSILKRRVENQNPRTIEDLKLRLTEEWAGLEPELLSLLSHSMVDRCEKVKQNNGHKIDY